jgi:hypothetical protein
MWLKYALLACVALRSSKEIWQRRARTYRVRSVKTGSSGQLGCHFWLWGREIQFVISLLWLPSVQGYIILGGKWEKQSNLMRCCGSAWAEGE